MGKWTCVLEEIYFLLNDAYIERGEGLIGKGIHFSESLKKETSNQIGIKKMFKENWGLKSKSECDSVVLKEP